jgi:hypothetical protein
MTARTKQLTNPADEPAEMTGCVVESFEPGERGGMAAIDSV